MPDVQKYHDELKINGADIAEPMHAMPFGQTFSLRTPDGHLLGFYEA